MNIYILKDNETFTMKGLAKLLKKYDSVIVQGIKLDKIELYELEKFIKLNTLSYSLVTKKKLNQLKKKGKVLGRPKGSMGKNNIKDKYLQNVSEKVQYL